MRKLDCRIVERGPLTPAAKNAMAAPWASLGTKERYWRGSPWRAFSAAFGGC